MPISRNSESRILVTGGAGFIGMNYLIRRGNQSQDKVIINLDKLSYASNTAFLPTLSAYNNYHFFQGDILNADLVSTILHQYQINTIVHFAAESHVDRSIASPDEFIQSNIVGTYTLLECARQFWLNEAKFTENDCRFHHVSTDEVFGSLDKDSLPLLETAPYRPSSPYSASKAASDHLVTSYHHTYGLPVTLSHCTNNYGPYQHSEKLIPKVIHACLRGEDISIYGDGSQIRDWLYVDDHCAAIDLILERGKSGERYNIAGSCEMANLVLINQIKETVMQMMPSSQASSCRIIHAADRAGHDWRYALNTEKIRATTDWQPQTQLSDGLATTIQFYLNTKSSVINRSTDQPL